MGFRFTDYDCIGFDLDNVVIRYKLKALIIQEYHALSSSFIKNMGDPNLAQCLKEPLGEKDIDFMRKGLFLDGKNGNILNLNEQGQIISGSHGTKLLNKNELIGYYGEGLEWTYTNNFGKNFLNNPSAKIELISIGDQRPLLDYFDIPISLIFARLVDHHDKLYKNKNYNKYFKLIGPALYNMLNKDQFAKKEGELFNCLVDNPETFYHKCSENLKTWLKKLKETKLVFFMTGSDEDFASHSLVQCLGSDWRDYFDIGVFIAGKPNFYFKDTPFSNVEQCNELQKGCFYKGGNAKVLKNFFEKHTRVDPKILYVGDNIIQDVVEPTKIGWDTCYICEELDENHDAKAFVESNTWGNYLSKGQPSTIWRELMRKHSKLNICSLEKVAQFPINHAHKRL